MKKVVIAVLIACAVGSAQCTKDAGAPSAGDTGRNAEVMSGDTGEGGDAVFPKDDKPSATIKDEWKRASSGKRTAALDRKADTETAGSSRTSGKKGSTVSAWKKEPVAGEKEKSVLTREGRKSGPVAAEKEKYAAGKDRKKSESAKTEKAAGVDKKTAAPDRSVDAKTADASRSSEKKGGTAAVSKKKPAAGEKEKYTAGREGTKSGSAAAEKQKYAAGKDRMKSGSAKTEKSTEVDTKGSGSENKERGASDAAIEKAEEGKNRTALTDAERARRPGVLLVKPRVDEPEAK